MHHSALSREVTTEKLKALNDVLDMLRNEIPLPEKYRQHALQGNYAGCLECHIDGDFLLIWYDEVNNTIALFRLGSHSELLSINSFVRP